MFSIKGGASSLPLLFMLGAAVGVTCCSDEFVGNGDEAPSGGGGGADGQVVPSSGGESSEPRDDGGAAGAAAAGAPATLGGGGAGGGQVGPSYQDTVLADAPLAYWRMGTAEDKTVSDVSGNGNDLVLQGTGHVLGSDGAVRDDDGAIEFDGEKSFAIASDPRALDFTVSSPFTLECWARRSTGGASYFQHLISNVQGVAGNRDGFSLYLLPEAATNEVTRSVFEYNQPGVETGIWGPVLEESTWGHYVGVFHGTQVLLYVNGTLSEQEPVAGVLGPRTGPFAIGRSSGGGSFFKGTLDEIAVYPHALDAKAIARHFAFAK